MQIWHYSINHWQITVARGTDKTSIPHFKHQTTLLSWITRPRLSFGCICINASTCGPLCWPKAGDKCFLSTIMPLSLIWYLFYYTHFNFYKNSYLYRSCKIFHKSWLPDCNLKFSPSNVMILFSLISLLCDSARDQYLPSRAYDADQGCSQANPTW